MAYLGDFTAVLSNYHKALALAREMKHPDEGRLVRRIAHVLHIQGRSWLESGHTQVAIAHFEQGISLDRSNAMLWMWLALSHYNVADFPQALARLDEYINHVAPDAPFALAVVLRCRIYLLLDRIELSHQDYHRAMALDPKIALLKRIRVHLLRRGNALFQEATANFLAKDWARALTCLSLSIILEPNDPRRFVLRATIYRQCEQYESALDDLKEASIRTPPAQRSEIIKQTAVTFNDIALKHQSLGSIDQAVAYLNQAIILDPQVAAFFCNRGDCNRALKRLAHALADYKKADELSRNDPQTLFRISLVHNLFGTELFNKRDYFSAETEFSLAIENYAQVAIYFVNRGNCFFYTQNYTGALADFRMALQLDPSQTEAQARVAGLAGSFPDAQPRRPPRDPAAVVEHAAWLATRNFGNASVELDAAAIEADRDELRRLRALELASAAGVQRLYHDRPPASVIAPSPDGLLRSPPGAPSQSQAMMSARVPSTSRSPERSVPASARGGSARNGIDVLSVGRASP